MKKIICLFLLILAFYIHASAQYSEGVKDSARAEIQQLTADWNKAIINRDSLMLDKLLAAEYSLNGIVLRTTWMNNTLHHIVTDSLRIVGQLNISFYGQAVKSEGIFFWKASVDGIPKINGEYSICDIWIKRNGHWQVQLRMSSLNKMR